MEIRRATARDAGIVARLNREVQQLHADALPRLFKPPSEGIFAPVAFAELVADPDTVVFIGEAGGEPVGYLYAQVARRPATPLPMRRRSSSCITSPSGANTGSGATESG
jgi:hypothetical protein